MSKKIPIKKFSFRIILFSAIVAGLSALFSWIFPKYASPALPFIVLFFFIITLLSLYIVLREDNGKSGRKFVSSYMLSRIIKIFSCLIFLVLYLLLHREDGTLFSIAFFTIYMLFSIFEVIVLKKENEELSSKKQ